MEDSKEIQDAVNVERVANIVKENNYTNIKRLSELTYDYVNDVTH